MKFKSEPIVERGFALNEGDVFTTDKATYLIVKGIAKDFDTNSYKKDGYTYVNLTRSSLVFPKFNTLSDLKNHLIEKHSPLDVYSGENIVMDLGTPVSTSIER
jgi:hypothetical protein